MDNFQYYPPGTPRVNFSFGIQKALLDALANHEELTDDQFIQIVINAYTTVYPEKTVQQCLNGLLERVTKYLTTLNKTDADTPKSKPKKTLGTSYADWMSGLNSQAVCLFLADYDIPKALAYYWEEDYLLVQDAIAIKGQQISQNLLANMEGCMYGFGGSYSGDGGSSNANVIDLRTTDGKEALAQFGF